MKKFIVTEEEKHRIISLHKKLFSEQLAPVNTRGRMDPLNVPQEDESSSETPTTSEPDGQSRSTGINPRQTYPSLPLGSNTSTSTGTSTNPKETEGQVSPDFFEENKIYDFPFEKIGGSSSGGISCPAETDTETIKKFEDETKLLTYPGDKNYRYLKIASDWFAKNINNKKVFNISKCGYTTSVDRLNQKFPDTSTGN
jgi:hypothetical protein